MKQNTSSHCSRWFILAPLLATACVTPFDARVTTPHQGTDTASCTLASSWETATRPRLVATVTSRCDGPTGGVKVQIESQGVELARGDVEVTLPAHQTTQFETPAFEYPSQPGVEIRARFELTCDGDRHVLEASCTLPDPPIKDNR